MRVRRCRSRVASTWLLLAFIILAVLAAGCGGGGGGSVKEVDGSSYQQAVLDGWSDLESASDELVEAADAIVGQEDFEDFSSQLAETREGIESYKEELAGREVPAGHAEDQAALEDFLDAYDKYLEANQNTIANGLSGDAGEGLPTVVPMLEAAQQSLEDYRDSQDFNPAELDEGVWDIPHVLDEAIGNIVPGPLDIVDSWYAFFNAGDGESMYALLDAESPIRSDYDPRFFTTQVAEAYQGGLQASAHRFVEGEEDPNSGGDRVTLHFIVDYTATVNMEGETVPPSSEERVFEMVRREGDWYVFNIQAGGYPAFY